MGRGHLAYYQAMVKRGEIKPILGLADLQDAVEAWEHSTESPPVYHILSMESADPIADPDDVEFWWNAGLRVVGPAHFGHNTYIHGTGAVGGLKATAPPLYKAMRQAGMILDITHLPIPGQRAAASRGLDDSGDHRPGRSHWPGVLPVVH